MTRSTLAEGPYVRITHRFPVHVLACFKFRIVYYYRKNRVRTYTHDVRFGLSDANNDRRTKDLRNGAGVVQNSTEIVL